MYTPLSALAIFVSAALVQTVHGATSSSFVLVGDSTTANGTSTNSGGWGNGLCGSSATGNIASVEAGTPCINTAKNGASTGSFVADGYWAKSIAAIKAEVAKSRKTYVTIQFGHNDQKVGTPASMAANLTEMVKEVRSAGGEPVLVTPLTRRNFSNGKIADTLGPYADATKSVASSQGTHIIDLHQSSITYCEAIGETSCHVLNKTPDDNTHLNTNGATVFGRMVADLLTASYPGALPIVANAALSYNISHGIPSY